MQPIGPKKGYGIALIVRLSRLCSLWARVGFGVLGSEV